MATARARHILLSSKVICEDLKADIDKGQDFAEVARMYSECPSGQDGGDLGEFSKGDMVPEFDSVVFSGEIGPVHGPVKTMFGYHLIQIISRS